MQEITVCRSSSPRACSVVNTFFGLVMAPPYLLVICWQFAGGGKMKGQGVPEKGAEVSKSETPEK